MQIFESGRIQKQSNSIAVNSLSMQRTEAAKAHRIVTTLLAGYDGPVAVRLWDDRLFSGSESIQCVLHINHPGVLRVLILRRNIVRLAEAFIAGYIDVTGDFETLFSLDSHLTNIKTSLRQSLQLVFDALHLTSLKKYHFDKRIKAGNGQQNNSRKTISHHYDVGNDFYRLWLDDNMVYSCAYFRDSEQSLDEAQQDKLDYLCRKLRLHAGQSVLDIGCGWGALALWAAQHYGVTVHGITLSKEQKVLADERIRIAGLEDRIRIELRDYRNLQGNAVYDRVISVGMFEHIGVNNFPQYFGKIKQVLKPKGLFLNHGITRNTGWRETQLTRFINQYIFPDCELARISDVSDAMEKVGFEIVDVESLRRHYALTLRRWVEALEASKKQATEITSREIYRLWRLYMAGCAYYFEEGSINVHQVLAGHQLDQIPVPLCRDDLYKQDVNIGCESICVKDRQ